MTRTRALGLLMAVASLAGLPAATAGAAAAPSPNLIVILADDLGWTDLHCYGSDFYQTPNIDRLASEGMKFTQSYSAATVCSPTRAALLTGKYPARLHVTDWIPGRAAKNDLLLIPDWTPHLPTSEPTIATALKKAGYDTASIGKWHLGDQPYYPERHGFDLNIAGTGAGNPKSYFAPWSIASLREGNKGEYLTDRLADEAVKFIEQHRDKPFFLYLAHFAPHVPIQGRPDLAGKYRGARRAGQKQDNPEYAAMIESVDDSVGRIRRALEQLRLAERTVIVFTSDNGGCLPQTSNQPLRAGKGSCYEGGTRVPLIILWPGVTAPGSSSPAAVISMDLYPTLLGIADKPDEVGHAADGLSLVPLLRQGAALNRDALFWHYPHYQLDKEGGSTPYGAIRRGDMKLIEFYEDMRVELYDLSHDLGERHDLAAQMPGVVAELRDRLQAWRVAVGAQMPARNPNYGLPRPKPAREKPKKKPH